MFFERFSFVAFVPDYISVLFLAALPVGELRAALPVAVAVYHMNALDAYVWSVLGNMIPVIFLLAFLDPVSRFLMDHSRLAEKFFFWLFHRTRGKFSRKYIKYGQWALVAFVALPLPVTGAWTGSVAAFLFNIPAKKAFSLIFFGVCLSGIIVLLLTGGAFAFFR